MRAIMVMAAVLLPAVLCWSAPAMTKTEDRLNAVLATVNGEPISLGDVLHLTQAREFQAASSFTGETLAKAVYALRLEAVDELIDNKLILADYESRSFEIPPKDIEAAIDDAADRMGCRSRSELVRKLRENGSSIEEFRKRVREQLIIHIMLYREYSSVNFITPADLHRYYQEHEAEFSRPETIELAMLQLGSGSGDQAELRRDISAKLAADPDSFATLVANYSTGPGKGDGGRLGGIERKRLRSEFSEAVGEKPEVGRIYGPIDTADGVFWLKVLAYRPAEHIPFERSSVEIRRRLEAQLRRESREKYCARLRKGAIVRYFILAAPVMADGDKKEADKNSTIQP